MKKEKLYSDMHFGEELPTHEEIKALAEATATMLSDKTNKIITVMPRKNGKTVFITR